MSDRKAELERKKAKLAAMKEEKRRKDLEKQKREAAGESPGHSSNSSVDLRKETEKMLADLGIPDAPAPSSKPAPAAAPGEAAPAVATTGRKVTLTQSKVTQTNIPPKENVSYSKETQTPHEVVDKDARHWDYYAGSTRSNSVASFNGTSPRLTSYGSPRSGGFEYPRLEWEDEFHAYPDEDGDSVETGGAKSDHHKHGMPHVHPAEPAKTADDVLTPVEEKPAPVPELTEEEIKLITTSEDFVKFFDRASRNVERVIYENMFEKEDDDGSGEGSLADGEALKVNRQFFDDRWSKHRIVTSMDWSIQHPEMLVAAYNNNEDSPHEPDGVALLWNIKYKKDTPDYVFHCQSAVMSACFAKFHPNLIIGGTYSGQIVLWDNRSAKRTPVQRTPLSAAAHTHPVYCINVVGTQNAHNLISVSTDGKMCSWGLDMLAQPQDSMELQHKQSKSVAATCFSFFSGSVNNFVVGSEEGSVYTACRHGSKAGINDIFEGHQGPITGIDCHSVQGSIDFSQYFLTTSFDWTVKLWSGKENKALHSFEDNFDYIYDCKWSPIHPALFATVDGAGRLDLWNLNNDTEVPTASTRIEPAAAANKCLWHQSGQRIAVGDDLGKIHIYDVRENLSNPRQDEWSNFVHTLQELKNNQEEKEEEQSAFSSPLR